MIAEISVFSVSFWILTAMRPMQCHKGDCSRALAQQRQMNGLPTVTRRDGRTSSWLEVADCRRRRDGKSATRQRRSDRYRGAVPCRARYTRTTSLKLMRSGARSQWKLARVSVTWSERRKPAIDRAAVLRTDWRRFSRSPKVGR